MVWIEETLTVCSFMHARTRRARVCCNVSVTASSHLPLLSLNAAPML